MTRTSSRDVLLHSPGQRYANASETHLDDPVAARSWLDTVADDKHAVVQCGPAFNVVVHATHIQLEAGLVCLDGNAHRLVGNHLPQCRLVVLRDILRWGTVGGWV